MENKENNTLKTRIDILLGKEFFDSESGESMTGAELIALKLFKKALNGDIKAFQVIRDTCGQAPPVSIVSSDIDPEVVEEVERMIFSDEKENHDEK